MTLNGNLMRFCQQCGRFQALAEFDGQKRSCRKKLAAHNLQRKRRRDFGDIDQKEQDPKTSTQPQQSSENIQNEHSVGIEQSKHILPRVIAPEDRNNNQVFDVVAVPACPQPTDAAIANLSSNWLNSINLNDSTSPDDDIYGGIDVDAILDQLENGTSFACAPSADVTDRNYHRNNYNTITTGDPVLPPPITNNTRLTTAVIKPAAPLKIVVDQRPPNQELHNLDKLFSHFNSASCTNFPYFGSEAMNILLNNPGLG